MKTIIRDAEEIAKKAQLASIYEVCSYPKPGTVHRFFDFKDTKFEHFIASGVAVGSVMRRAALRGFRIGLGEASLREAEVGKHIRDCVVESRRWHFGGNTNLGIVTLLVPIVVGAGMLKAKHKKFNPKILRRNIVRVLRSTTVKDTINFYEAIRLAEAGGLEKAFKEKKLKDLDVTCKESLENIVKKKVRLYNVMVLCSGWDGICKEWVTGMHITFKVGYPTIKKVYLETKDLNRAITQCFLTILAKNPDSLIARKNGWEKAKEVSEKAKKVLDAGGTLTVEGIKKAEALDLELRTPDNRLNPGTTADLTASSIMVSLLDEIKP